MDQSKVFRFALMISGIERIRLLSLIVLYISAVAGTSLAADDNRLSYLDSNEVWFPNKTLPKFTTPQWVGDEGVECVVVLAIDDMRESAKYEAYLRPILQRLKAIDGRAPVSIMTCSVIPDDPQLQSWLQEGLSLECHTFGHPCPLLTGGNIRDSKATYDKCIDLMESVPNNKPVAFRTPCCDSLNTVSPRLFSEIINKTTESHHFLQLDSSVFTLYTADDPEIPHDWLVDPDGTEKFRKYIPRRLKRGDQIHDEFVNTIENYPYPYVIQNKCWEFPCIVPSDWSANHLHKPNNPDTVRDLKMALDITVLKQGVMNLVFHPHGWIKAEQIVELIEHAVAKHGKKVKFLNFKECVDRLKQNVTAGQPLRDARGEDNGVRLVDISGDGFMDVVISNRDKNSTRTWSPKQMKWIKSPNSLQRDRINHRRFSDDFVWWTPDSVFKTNRSETSERWNWRNDSRSWSKDANNDFGLENVFRSLGPAGPFRLTSGLSSAVSRDVDNDGVPEFLIQVESKSLAISFQLNQSPESKSLFTAYNWFPKGVVLRDDNDLDAGLRFVDLNEDGRLDIVVSNHERYGAWLFESKSKGWSIELLNAKRDGTKPEVEWPLIARDDGSDNGFFVKDRQLRWINEDTANRVDFMSKVSFDQLLGDRIPEAKSPESAIKSMRVRPGFQIELVAHEPLTMDPVAFDWGSDGKFWVAEMADYPLGIDGKGAPGGRIRYLEDTDGDGRYDKSTLFLDKVAFPNGVLVWKKGVLVSAAPDIFYAEDTNGDGKADLREVLFTGFTEGNQQHRVNGFSRGLDNWLYLANGDSGGTVKSIKTGEALDLRSRDLRIRPETGAMEAIAGTSQFGRNRDDWGNWFGNNNSRPMWHFVLDDHYLRRNPFLAAPNLRRDVSVTPGAAQVFPASKTLTRFNDFHTANHFTSACGAIVDRDNFLFGTPETDSSPHLHTFVSEPVHNLVHHEVMSADGISFTSQRAVGEDHSEFVASTDNWFRPTMLRTGPDGALWIADMYRLVIEHPQWIPIEWQRKLNVRAGDDKGRIWRVSPVGSKPRTIPRFNHLNSQELVKSLDSLNGWQRDLVQQLLVERADPATIPLLRQQAKQSDNPLCRLHSLYALDGIPSGLDASFVAECLTDQHPGIRRHVVRLLESVGEPSSATFEKLTKLAEDTDAQVRLQLAYTLGEFKSPIAGTLLGRIARRSVDQPLILTAVISSFRRDNLTEVLAEVVEGGAAPSDLLETLLGQATAFEHEDALAALLLKATDPSQDGRYAPWQFSAVNQFLISLTRHDESLDHWLSQRSAKAKPLGSRLRALFVAASNLATDETAPVGDRVAAVRVLGHSAGDIDRLAELLRPQNAPELQSTALETIARMKSPEVGTKLVANYRSLSPTIRTQTASILLRREAWRDELLSALESNRISPADVDASSRQLLLGHNNTKVRERAAKLLAVDLNTDRARLVADYLPIVRAGGDAQEGSRIFAKRCAQCHKLGEVGHIVGPDLAAVRDKSAESLITAILDPNRAVEARYLNFTAVSKAGVTYNGLLASETASSLTLRAAEGKEVSLLRNEIEELQSSTKSLMPEGLERDLKPADAAALIAYIRQNVPLPAMKKFPGNEPRVVQPDASGKFTLTPFEAEIYGSTIVIEPQHKNLGWWSSADDVVIWTINVAKPGRYSVDWTWACDAQASGNRVTVQVLGKSFTTTVGKTAGWDDYQTAKLGELDLPMGELRLTLKPASRPLPALGDVKAVVLQLKE